MRMQSIALKIVLLGVVIVVFPVLAQQPNPACKQCSATYVPKSELDAYRKRGVDNHSLDQLVRAVDVGNGQVGIASIYRWKLPPGQVNAAAEHDKVSEVYYILEGTATIATGPDLVDPKPRPADSVAVKELDGPGANATSIKNPESHELKPGDMFIIPAGVGHMFTKIDDHITYVMVRVDPERMIQPKSEAQSQGYLNKPYKPGMSNF